MAQFRQVLAILQALTYCKCIILKVE